MSNETYTDKANNAVSDVTGGAVGTPTLLHGAVQLATHSIDFAKGKSARPFEGLSEFRVSTLPTPLSVSNSRGRRGTSADGVQASSDSVGPRTRVLLPMFSTARTA